LAQVITSIRESREE
jgi:hypothetical protein